MLIIIFEMDVFEYVTNLANLNDHKFTKINTFAKALQKQYPDVDNIDELWDIYVETKKRFQQANKINLIKTGKYVSKQQFQQLTGSTKHYNKLTSRLNNHNLPVDIPQYINELKQAKRLVPDSNIKHINYRISYSPIQHSYEIDVAYFDGSAYLFAINSNTRYLYVFPIANETQNEIEPAIYELNNKTPINELKGDGEKSFGFLAQYFKTYFNSSPYVYHNKIVDRVIRTIRDMVGNRTYLLTYPDAVDYLVNQYNMTINRMTKVSPNEMQTYPELEIQWIQYCKNKNEMRLNKNKYKPGNVIFIHLSHSKTAQRFAKRRRNYDRLALFESYNHGNVQCKIITPDLHVIDDIIILPAYYTKYCCTDINSIPKYVYDVIY
jgi:hypothetical protein